MKDMWETLQALQNTPVPNLLVISGFFLILLTFVGRIGAVINIPKEQQRWAGQDSVAGGRDLGSETESIKIIIGARSTVTS